MSRSRCRESRHDFGPRRYSSPKLLQGFVTGVLAFLFGITSFASEVQTRSIEGRVVESSGNGIEGVMVSAIDDEHRKWTSVFTQKDGSFAISGLRNVEHRIRTRLMGLADQWNSGVAAGTHGMVIQTRPAAGDELELQRPASGAPKKRGNYPHTLRINPKDPEGLIWCTDAGSNSCFSIHPQTHVVKEYKLLSAGQAIGAGRGESRGITPYGLDDSPVDGMIWYSKLNGNRIGRIDPSAGSARGTCRRCRHPNLTSRFGSNERWNSAGC